LFRATKIYHSDRDDEAFYDRFLAYDFARGANGADID
jgi:hypothetical protein